MFDQIQTSHYGRSVKHYRNWSLPTFAVNRLYYIHSGECTVLLDGRPHRLRAGFIYLIPQNLDFSLVLTAETRVDHTFLDFFTLPVIKMDRFTEIDPTTHPLIRSAAKILFDLAEAYPTYNCRDFLDRIPLVESYLRGALALIHQDFPILTVSDARINRALEYIHRSYAREITLDQLISLTKLERNYFIRLFKRCMNMTPFQYIKKYRLNVGLTLLKEHCSITDVAARVGYGDISAFSHAFKQLYGIYPSELVRSYES